MHVQYANHGKVAYLEHLVVMHSTAITYKCHPRSLANQRTLGEIAIGNISNINWELVWKRAATNGTQASIQVYITRNLHNKYT